MNAGSRDNISIFLAVVLKMHKYQSVNYTKPIFVVAFSAIPRRNGPEASTEEESIFGYTKGAMSLKVSELVLCPI